MPTRFRSPGARRRVSAYPGRCFPLRPWGSPFDSVVGTRSRSHSWPGAAVSGIGRYPRRWFPSFPASRAPGRALTTNYEQRTHMADLASAKYGEQAAAYALIGAQTNVVNPSVPARSTFEWGVMGQLTDNAAAASDALYAAVPVDPGTVITKITVWVGNTAASTPTHQFGALYSGLASSPALLGSVGGRHHGGHRRQGRLHIHAGEPLPGKTRGRALRYLYAGFSVTGTADSRSPVGTGAGSQRQRPVLDQPAIPGRHVGFVAGRRCRRDVDAGRVHAPPPGDRPHLGGPDAVRSRGSLPANRPRPGGQRPSWRFRARRRRRLEATSVTVASSLQRA